MDRSPIREDSSQPLKEVDQEDVGGPEGVGAQEGVGVQGDVGVQIREDSSQPLPEVGHRGPRIHLNFSKS